MIRVCDLPGLPVPTEQSNLREVFLDLSKQVSGDGTLYDPYSWWDILTYLQEADTGQHTRINTIGSNMGLLSDINSLEFEGIQFANSLGQAIEFVAYAPFIYNIPMFGNTTSTLYTQPFFRFTEVSGLTIKFNGFRINNLNEALVKTERCSNCNISFINCAISPAINDFVPSPTEESSSSSSGYDFPDFKATFIRMINCTGMKTSLILNSVTDISQSLTFTDFGFISENNSIYNNVKLAGVLDAGNQFDTGITFDQDSEMFSNIFYIIGNYFSYQNILYPVIRTDNYKSEVKKAYNTYMINT